MEHNIEQWKNYSSQNYLRSGDVDIIISTEIDVKEQEIIDFIIYFLRYIYKHPLLHGI